MITHIRLRLKKLQKTHEPLYKDSQPEVLTPPWGGRIIIPGGARPSVLMTGNSPTFYFLSAFVCSFEVDYGKTLLDLDLLVWDILSCPYA